MERYLILLRGINVSGQKKIKMSDLKEILLSNGYKNIVTLLQTGNILLDSSKDKNSIKADIKDIIFKKYKFEVPVLILKKSSLEAIIKNLPFNNLDLEKLGNKILISILSEYTTEENVSKLMNYVKPPELLEVKGNIVYLHCPNGYGKSKLTNNFLENKLKVISTTRNLNTLNKLNNME